jgi:hypothetical protein
MTINIDALTRRNLLKGVGATLLAASASRDARADESDRADASWLANCRIGISTHWTAQSKPVGADDWLPFEDTVERFSPAHYVDQVAGAGAEYVIFTGAHALQMLPAPCEAIDRVLPGRTTKRDLIGDLADACHARGLRFILYYNHSCNQGDDPDWEYAVGYHAPEKSRLMSNLLGIIRELSARYGTRLDGWWFDSCGSLDPNDWHHGFHNVVTTEMHGFKVDWDEWVKAAKTGFNGRLVTLNPGMLYHYVYSTHQDYEAGEANQPVGVPSSQFTQDHLQGHRWVCLDNASWVHSRVMTPLAAPLYNREYIEAYVRDCNRVKVPVTFNVDIDRTGLLSRDSLAMLREVRKQLG